MNPETLLNPQLYRALVHKFGPVKVTNQGEARVVHPDFLGDGSRPHVAQWGETYWVRCPLCDDAQRRLAVSYLYGRADAPGLPRIPLANCQNAGCMRDPDNRLALEELVGVRLAMLDSATVCPGRVVSDDDRVVELPAPRTRLDELRKGHPARRFLMRQGFKPDTIGKFYGASYYDGRDDRVARGRIIIPVHLGGKLRGWQALSIQDSGAGGGRGGSPSYLSAAGMRSSMLVYNLDRARQYHTGVVVEEPTDVWAFGPMAVRLLGDTFADRPFDLIRDAFHGRAVVLLVQKAIIDRLHSSALEDKLQARLANCLAVVERPQDLPPGAKAREHLRRLVKLAAKARRLRISYDKSL